MFIFFFFLKGLGVKGQQVPFSVSNQAEAAVQVWNKHSNRPRRPKNPVCLAANHSLFFFFLRLLGLCDIFDQNSSGCRETNPNELQIIFVFGSEEYQIIRIKGNVGAFSDWKRLALNLHIDLSQPFNLQPVSHFCCRTDTNYSENKCELLLLL